MNRFHHTKNQAILSWDPEPTRPLLQRRALEFDWQTQLNKIELTKKFCQLNAIEHRGLLPACRWKLTIAWSRSKTFQYMNTDLCCHSESQNRCLLNQWLHVKLNISSQRRPQIARQPWKLLENCTTHRVTTTLTVTAPDCAALIHAVSSWSRYKRHISLHGAMIWMPLDEISLYWEFYKSRLWYVPTCPFGLCIISMVSHVWNHVWVITTPGF